MASTPERILKTSLKLFNDEGEAQQSAVDIANALEMSPGNLYYHYKGKDAIIHALFESFEEEMQVILRGSRGRIETVEDAWVYFYIILEEIYDFRFFYRNLGELLNRYPDLAVRFRVVLEDKRAAIEDVLDGLSRKGLIRVDQRMEDILVDQIRSSMTFWLARNAVFPESGDAKALIDRTVFESMALIVPHMGEDSVETLNALIDRYESRSD